MLGPGRDNPSLKPRQVKYRLRAGVPKLMARRNAAASGCSEGATPLTRTSSGPRQRTAAISTTPTASASQSACRSTGPVAARRPAPSSCATVGGTAYDMPKAVTNAIAHTLAPTETDARTWAPRCPASSTSTVS